MMFPGESSPPYEAVILVVDDDDLLRRMLEMYFSRRHYKVFTAASADEAMEIAQREKDTPIDLLITDIGIPGADGFELARRFGKLIPSARFLFLSGSLQQEFQLTEKPSSAWQFLKKPCAPSDVGEVVRNLLTEGGAA
jgi:two-component system cell cycle sensor histidine kinase/response regulator CckA